MYFHSSGRSVLNLRTKSSCTASRAARAGYASSSFLFITGFSFSSRAAIVLLALPSMRRMQTSWNRWAVINTKWSRLHLLHWKSLAESSFLTYQFTRLRTTNFTICQIQIVQIVLFIIFCALADYLRIQIVSEKLFVFSNSPEKLFVFSNSPLVRKKVLYFKYK